MMNSTTDVVQFKPSAYDAPEAANFRQVMAVEHSKKMKALLEFNNSGNWQGVGLVSTMPLALAGSFTVIFAFGLGIVDQSLLGAVLCGAATAATSSIFSLPLFTRTVRKQQQQARSLADSAARAANEELQQWLRENYGLRGQIGANLELIEDDNAGIPIFLSTLEGVKLSADAELKPVADGSYELRKTAVKRADESVYFDRVDSAHQLTANRRPAAAALTAGR